MRGIYLIKNIINNKCYIGSSKDIRQRFNKHRNDLRKGRNHNILLQRAWDKYHEENFKFEILEECDENNLIIREQYYLDTLKHEYNIVDIAGRPLGYKHTKEAKEKISRANKGRQFTEEHKLKLSINLKGKNKGKSPWIKGRKHTEVSLKKMSESLKGRVVWNKGKHHSEESKRKMSLSHSGRLYPGRRKFKEDDMHKLIEMKNRNISILEIAKHFNCSLCTVYRELKRLEFAKREFEK